MDQLAAQVERLATAAMPALNSAMKKVLRTMEGLSHHAKGLDDLSHNLSGLSQQALPQLSNAAKAMEDSFTDVSKQMDEVAKDYQKLQKEHKSYVNALTFSAGKTDTSETGDSKKGDVPSDQGKKSETVFQKLGTKIKDVLLNTVQKAINALGPMMQTGVENMAKAWPVLGQSLDIVKTSLTNLSNSMGAMVAPVLITVLPIFNQIVNAAINAANAIGMFFTKLLGGRETYVKIGEVADSATSSSGSQPEGSAGGALTYEEVPIDSNVAGFADSLLQTLGPVKEALGLLTTELEKLGQFAWQGLVDFYTMFLAPIGKWVLGTGLPDFINILSTGLATVQWDIIQGSLKGLWEALAPFAIHVGEGLLWLWENVLGPFGTWVMNDVVPAFLDLLSAVLTDINQVIDIVKPAFQFLWDNFLKPIAEWTGGAIVGILSAFTNELNKVSFWLEENKDFLTVVATLLLSLGAAWVIVTGATKAWSLISTGVPKILLGMNNAANSFFSSINPGVLIIGALIAAFAYAWQTSEGFRDAIMGIVESVKNAWNALMEGNWDEVGRFIVEGLMNGLSAIWELIKALWDGFINLCKSILGINSPSTVFAEVGDYLAQGLLQGFQVILDLLVAVWDGIVAGAQALWDGIVAIFMTVAEWFIASVVTPLLEVFSVLWETLKNLPAEAWLFIQETWLGVCEWFNTVIILPLMEFFSLLWETLKNLPAEAWLFIQETWLGVCEWFNTVIITPLLAFFSLLWETLKNLPAEAWLFIQETWLGVCEWFNTVIILPLMEFFSSALTNIGNFFSAAWTNIKTVWNTVTTWFNVHIITPVREAFSAMIDNVRGFFSGLIDFFKGLFHADFEGAWNAVCEIFGGIWDTMYGNVKAIINKIIGVINKMIKGIEGGVNWIIDGINRAFDFIRGIANGAAGLLAKAGIEVEFTVPSFEHITLGTIPTLASGAVLTQRTLFEGGEYPGARSNPEIVSPVSMMKGAFKQALAEQNGAGGSFTAEHPIELSLDGDVFYRAMVKIKQNRGVTIGSAFAEAY